jgi:hypothetical protein
MNARCWRVSSGTASGGSRSKRAGGDPVHRAHPCLDFRPPCAVAVADPQLDEMLPRLLAKRERLAQLDALFGCDLFLRPAHAESAGGGPFAQAPNDLVVVLFAEAVQESARVVRVEPACELLVLDHRGSGE